MICHEIMSFMFNYIFFLYYLCYVLSLFLFFFFFSLTIQVLPNTMDFLFFTFFIAEFFREHFIVLLQPF